MFQVVFEVAGVEAAVVEDLEAAVVEDLEVDVAEEASEEEAAVVDVDSEVGRFSVFYYLLLSLFVRRYSFSLLFTCRWQMIRQ